MFNSLFICSVSWKKKVKLTLPIISIRFYYLSRDKISRESLFFLMELYKFLDQIKIE